jgi:hypothetical protein
MSLRSFPSFRALQSTGCTRLYCCLWRQNALGIFEIDLQIKGKKFTHHINVLDKLTDNNIGNDFIHKHKMHYDVQTRQVKIAGIDVVQIVALKEQVLPSLA